MGFQVTPTSLPLSPDPALKSRLHSGERDHRVDWKPVMVTIRLSAPVREKVVLEKKL